MKMKFVNGDWYKYVSKYSNEYKDFARAEKAERKVQEANGMPYHPMCFVACGFVRVFDRQAFMKMVDESKSIKKEDK